MSRRVSCREVATLMHSNSLHAVLDVRERGEFNDGHISNATSLPRSQIEYRIASLVPNRKLPIVVYDDGSERAALAAKTLAEFGYGQASVLEGGLSAWQEEGRQTVSGVNVPGKAFGEQLHHKMQIPEITPGELKSLQEVAADLLILDVRTPEEYGRFCIPGGLNVPGGDLVLWAEELKGKTDSTIVVNCAGRTRSIIGTATLRRLGLANVRALKNGTMGWVLAGFELEAKPARTAPLAPVESRDKATALALRIAAEEGIAWIAAPELSSFLTDGSSEVIYLIDVGSASEYETGHIPGSLSVPGGQAVQRADDFIAVRNGRIIFISNRGSRAVMAAYWYRRMGYRDVRVLRGGLEAWRANNGPVMAGPENNEPLGLEHARQAVRLLAPAEVESLLRSSATVILDVGSSIEYEAAHIPAAKWISRGWLEIKLGANLADKGASILLSCSDGRHSTFAARSLEQFGYKNVCVLSGGVKAWVAGGLPSESGRGVHLTEPNDVVLSPSIRGSKEDMQRYLDWEVRLSGSSG